MSRHCQKVAKIQKAIALEQAFKENASEKGLIAEHNDAEIRLTYLRNQIVIHNETCKKNSCREKPCKALRRDGI